MVPLGPEVVVGQAGSAGSQATRIAAGRQYLVDNYRQQPLVLERGEGARVWDADGVGYLDFAAGVAVSSLGHAHPRLVAAVCEQAGRLLHTSNLYYSGPQLELAAELARRSFDGQVFFCNSGAEANEAALKLARRWQLQVREDPDRVELVAFEGSFHGRTAFALSVTGQAKYRSGFGPLVGPVRFVPYGDVPAAMAAIGSRTCAVIVEPVQGEGGVVVPPPGFLAALRRRCDEAGALLIFDEVQTGIGRTGTLFAWQAAGVVPDVMTLAKGLGGGVPIGALVARPEAARALAPGSHASTFGGNPLACAAALAVLHTIDDEGLLARAQERGAQLGAGLQALAARLPARVREARGLGLLRGLAVVGEAAEVVARARELGLLVSMAGPQVVRLTPPLIVSDEQIEAALTLLEQALVGGRA
jgi:predicted acetylornithine/succinylornithine family transaminase